MVETLETTKLVIYASGLMLGKYNLTRDHTDKEIVNSEKEIEKMKANLLINEDKLIQLKALTDEDIEGLRQLTDKKLDKIVKILEEKDCKEYAELIRSLREGSDSELPKPS